MRVIVTGASGFIGNCFMKTFSDGETLGTALSRVRPELRRVDLRDREATQAMIDQFQPDAVIHCAARPTVDWCEHNQEAARELNVKTTEYLAEGCLRAKAALVFISTDYVFDGEAGPYCEFDQTNPINVYGKLKLEAEYVIQNTLDDHVIARTTNVYGFDLASKNFLMGILPRLARGERIQVAHDQLGTPTLVADLCRAVRELLAQKQRGVFHITGPDFVNRVEWAQAAAKAFGLNADLVGGVDTEELNQPAPRPKKAGLVSERLGSSTREPMRGLTEGLEAMKRDWNSAPPVAEWQ